MTKKKLSSNVGFRFQQYADCPMMQHPPVINHDKRLTYKHIHLRRNTRIIFTNTHTQMHSLEFIKSRVGKQRASYCNISESRLPLSAWLNYRPLPDARAMIDQRCRGIRSLVEQNCQFHLTIDGLGRTASAIPLKDSMRVLHPLIIRGHRLLVCPQTWKVR